MFVYSYSVLLNCYIHNWLWYCKQLTNFTLLVCCYVNNSTYCIENERVKRRGGKSRPIRKFNWNEPLYLGHLQSDFCVVVTLKIHWKKLAEREWKALALVQSLCCSMHFAYWSYEPFLYRLFFLRKQNYASLHFNCWI